MLLLRFARIQQGISAKEIAKRLGLTPSYIRLIESGAVEPSPDFMRRFSEAYGIEALELLDPIEVELPEVSLR